MSAEEKSKRAVYRSKSIAATGLAILLIAALFATAYFQIQRIVRESSMERLEENVETVMEEIHFMLDKDSQVLNAAAEIVSMGDLSDQDALTETLRTVDPLTQTMNICLLLPSDEVLLPNGKTIDVSDRPDMSFEEASALGEHITDRVRSLLDNSLVLRHMVPVVQNGKTAAMLYGIMSLEELPENLSIRNIYHGRASIYLIDTRTGDFLLDTYPTHTSLVNIADMDTPDRETRGDADWHEYVSSMLSLGQGTVQYRTPRTEGWEYMYYRPVGVNQWSISISVPESEALSVLYQIQHAAILIAIVLMAVISGYMVYIYRQVKMRAADATEQAVRHARLEEKLTKARAAEQAKTVFLTNMSHDIRTPMNAIIGFTTLAETNIENQGKVREYLDKIRSSSSHLLSLINDILDMSRIESGKLSIEEQPHTLSEIFKDIRNMIQTQMLSNQLDFTMETIDVVDEEILCDKLHVNQILLNLLSNAIKFTPAGGSVTLTLRQIPDPAAPAASAPAAPAALGSAPVPQRMGHYEIRVKDTGIGMSQEFAAHLFEAFERERTSTVSGIQGTGLGMTITRSIVEAMGGTITVETEQSKGTEFIIKLSFTLQDTAETAAEISEFAGRRALVAEPKDSVCESEAAMLRRLGLKTVRADSSSEAIQQAEKAAAQGEPFQVFLVDSTLTEPDAPETIRKLAAQAAQGALVIYTTAVSDDLPEEIQKAGAAAACSKPLFLSDLKRILTTAVPLENAQEPEPSDPMDGMYGLRLLLVEDNELNREIAQELLEDSGFEVETANDGLSGVEMVSGSLPGYYALVLMDIQMPVMNGYDATRAIRALGNPQLAQIPIIAMTANAFDEDKRRAMECGMDAHVAKPFDLDKLLVVLKSILTTHSSISLAS